MWLSGSRFQALGLIPAPHKMNTVAHACNPNTYTWEVEAGQDRKFKVILSFAAREFEVPGLHKTHLR